MTESVNTNGFTIPQGNPGVMPQDAKPGFVTPQQVPVGQPAEKPAEKPAGTSADDSLAAAIAALTAALPSKEPVPEKTAANASESLNVLDIGTIEDPTLRSMAGAFKMLGAGLDLDRIFSKALEAGDVGLLDMAYLREKAGANADGLAGLAESIVRLTNQQAESAQKEVHALAGGEANWNAATTAFNKGAPAEFKLAVIQMMDSGKPAQVSAAAKLVVQFAKGQGYVPTPAGLLNSGAGQPSGQALDKAGFQTALQKLNPNDRDYMTQRGELFARRALGKQLGQ